MGVACLKFNARNCGDVVNALNMQNVNFTNSVDPDETPHNRVCAICHVKHILGNGGNIKSYMNQDLFHFVNGCF